MYKVLIVDDEKWVAALVRNSIDWPSLGLSLIGEAYSGSDAHDLILRERPDIVITDICMPGMDGVALMEQCRLAKLDTEFIVLSGHNNFSYAQSAMKNNAACYILKPVDEDELADALKTVRERIEKRREADGMAVLVTDSLDELRATFLQKLLSSGDQSPIGESLEEINKKYAFSFSGGQYLVVIQQFEPFEGPTSFALASCREETGAFAKYAYSFFGENRLISILNLPFSIHDDLDAPLKHLFARQNAVCQAEGIAVTMGVGCLVQSFFGLGRAYRSALDALRSRVIYGGGRMYRSAGDHAEIHPCASLSINKGIAISALIETYNGAELAQLLNGLIDQLMEIMPSTQNLFVLLRQIAETYEHSVDRMGLGDALHFQSVDVVMEQLEQCDSLERLKAVLQETLCAPLTSYASNELALETQISAQIKNYVCKNYYKNIRLIDIADELYRNPSYVGFVFKRDTGISFSEYLAAYRIDIAKSYLADLRYTVASVAEMVGFSDFRYFTRTFKRLVGITPNEFRKNPARVIHESK